MCLILSKCKTDTMSKIKFNGIKSDLVMKSLKCVCVYIHTHKYIVVGIALKKE